MGEEREEVCPVCNEPRKVRVERENGKVTKLASYEYQTYKRLLG